MNYMAIADLCRLVCLILVGGAIILAIYVERGGNRIDHQPPERKTP